MSEAARGIESGVAKSRAGWFKRITALFTGARLDDALWEELEELLVAADLGVPAAQGVLEATRRRVQSEGVADSEAARRILAEELVALLRGDGSTPAAQAEDSALEVLLVVGVNGVGKTTTIAKLGHLFRERGERVLFAAADTFRAAAIDQLQVWGERVGVEVVAHKPEADPGAVVYDAVQAAVARGVSKLIVDTAGRLHTKFNLMEELKKMRRVISRAAPQARVRALLVLDATTGQNGLAQARAFSEALGVEGVVLAKLDGTAKGGIAFAIVRELGLPILYAGVGERPEDIVAFDPEGFVRALLAA